MPRSIKNKLEKFKKEDILERLHKDNTDTEIINSIITNIENTILEGVNKNLCVAIPYMGRVYKDRYREVFKEARIILHNAKDNLTKEEYVEYRKSVFQSYIKRVDKEFKSKQIVERLIRLNKKKYNKLYAACGKTYADTWIKKIAYLQIVEHDINDPNEV